MHLLQGKEIGTFIVRGSSQKNTMAISVRLPLNAGPYIEHYLIQSSDGLLNLESSRFKFDSIPSLVAHYSNCCDELPVQLRLVGLQTIVLTGNTLKLFISLFFSSKVFQEESVKLQDIS